MHFISSNGMNTPRGRPPSSRSATAVSCAGVGSTGASSGLDSSPSTCTRAPPCSRHHHYSSFQTQPRDFAGKFTVASADHISKTPAWRRVTPPRVTQPTSSHRHQCKTSVAAIIYLGPQKLQAPEPSTPTSRCFTFDAVDAGIAFSPLGVDIPWIAGCLWD